MALTKPLSRAEMSCHFPQGRDTGAIPHPQLAWCQMPSHKVKSLKQFETPPVEHSRRHRGSDASGSCGGRLSQELIGSAGSRCPPRDCKTDFLLAKFTRTPPRVSQSVFLLTNSCVALHSVADHRPHVHEQHVRSCLASRHDDPRTTLAPRHPSPLGRSMCVRKMIGV